MLSARTKLLNCLKDHCHKIRVGSKGAGHRTMPARYATERPKSRLWH